MGKLILRGSARYLHYTYGKIKKDSIDYIMLNLPFLCNYQCIKCCNRFRKFKTGVFSIKEIKNTILDYKAHPEKLAIIRAKLRTIKKPFALEELYHVVCQNGTGSAS